MSQIPESGTLSADASHPPPHHHHLEMSGEKCAYEIERDAQVNRNQQFLKDLEVPSLTAPKRSIVAKKPQAEERFQPKRDTRAILSSLSAYEDHNSNRIAAMCDRDIYVRIHAIRNVNKLRSLVKGLQHAERHALAIVASEVLGRREGGDWTFKSNLFRPA